MNENQRGALLSFSYNLGAHFYNTRGFDTISRVLREKDWDGVPDALYLYRNPAPVLRLDWQDEGLLEGELWKTPVTKYVPFHHPV